MIEIIIFIFIFYCIFKSTSNNTSNLEKILTTRNFQNLQYSEKYYLTANKHSMKYLFIKNHPFDANINFQANLLQSYNVYAKNQKCDRIIIYYPANQVPLELTKLAATYNIEIWNKAGTSNFNSFRTTKPNSNNSRLASALVKETKPLEHRKNGVIAQDTCHIAPTTSPIETNTRKSILKRKQPQRL